MFLCAACHSMFGVCFSGQQQNNKSITATYRLECVYHRNTHSKKIKITKLLYRKSVTKPDYGWLELNDITVTLFFSSSLYLFLF